MKNVNISEYGVGIDTIKIEAYQSATFVKHTRRLSELVIQGDNVYDISCLARATILMGAAALEALVMEVAYIKRPDLYSEKNFRRSGFIKKVEILKGKAFLAKCQDEKELWDYRIALTHSEPVNDRTRKIGKITNLEGAQWVANTVEKFSAKIWGEEMPSWFSKTTGLSSE